MANVTPPPVKPLEKASTQARRSLVQWLGGRKFVILMTSMGLGFIALMYGRIDNIMFMAIITSATSVYTVANAVMSNKGNEN